MCEEVTEGRSEAAKNSMCHGGAEGELATEDVIKL